LRYQRLDLDRIGDDDQDIHGPKQLAIADYRVGWGLMATRVPSDRSATAPQVLDWASFLIAAAKGQASSECPS
jgi:hypothetical protein